MKIEQPFSVGGACCFEDLSIGDCFIFEDHKSTSGYIYPGTVHMKISKKGSAVRMRDGWVDLHEGLRRSYRLSSRRSMHQL